MKLKITKRFGRKITENYKSWEFMTELTQDDIEVNSLAELIEENRKLFSKAKGLTEIDMSSCQEQIKSTKAGGKNV
jgi:ubiquinone/menaquinone biosynthesis C-methylase UbiE